MLEAKDTVMSKEQIKESYAFRSQPPSDIRIQRDIAKAQAEISFPLGEKQGMRKVVEWMCKYQEYWESSTYTSVHITHDELQSFLKENGLEETGD